VLGVPAKNSRAQRLKVRNVKVVRSQFAAADGRCVEQLDEGDERCVLTGEPDTREVQVVPPPVSPVVGEQKRMVHTVALPEGDSVGVILEDASEAGTVLNRRGVVGVQTDEQEGGSVRLSALERPVHEALPQLQAGVKLKHVREPLTSKNAVVMRQHQEASNRLRQRRWTKQPDMNAGACAPLPRSGPKIGERRHGCSPVARPIPPP
jgi:hypothetical protein